MMRLLLIILAALLIGSALALGMQYDLGYIRISYGHYLIETNFWVGVALFLLLLVISVIVVNLLRGLRRSTGVLSRWLARGSEQRARHRTTKGLLALAEGNWPRARKLLTSAADKAEMPLINYLAAAQAAFESGDHDAVDELLRKAYESTPGSDLAVGITQAQLQLAGNRLEEALATLLRLRNSRPVTPLSSSC